MSEAEIVSVRRGQQLQQRAGSSAGSAARYVTFHVLNELRLLALRRPEQLAVQAEHLPLQAGVGHCVRMSGQLRQRRSKRSAGKRGEEHFHARTRCHCCGACVRCQQSRLR